MNFFKSVFSDDPDPSSPPLSNFTPPDSPNSQSHSPTPNPTTDFPAISTAWSFGSTLFKSLATKSESVIETYRRDIEEFSSGLKQETSTIRQAASRAVESGATVAQTSLESVGQAIDDITDVIITRGKDSISMITSDDVSDSELSDKNENLIVKPYSRAEASIRSIQCDLKTYCEEPEDLEDYREWLGGFLVEEKRREIKGLLEGNKDVREIYDEVIPVRVDHETFWLRYFYKVYKMERAEEARLRLVKRAIEGEDEELSWDVDDDEEGEGGGGSGGFKTMNELKKEIEENVSEVEGGRSSGGFKMMDELKKEIEENVSKVVGLEDVVDEKGLDGERNEMESFLGTRSDDAVEEKGNIDEVEASGEKIGKSDEKASSEGKNDNSDFSVVSSQPSHEEDLGWDEIEDIGSDDEKNVVARTSPNRTDLRKRLSAAEEDEDLTWDIEDDDEPAKL